LREGKEGRSRRLRGMNRKGQMRGKGKERERGENGRKDREEKNKRHRAHTHTQPFYCSAGICPGLPG